MKIFLILYAVAVAGIDKDLIGTWKYDGFEYDGQTYPRPNPSLDLKFTFNEKGEAKLKWDYENEPGFCERLATYDITEAGLLHQKITWVNPDNFFYCSQDVDMELGRESLTPYSIHDQQLRLSFEINGKPFLYILNKLKTNKTNKETK